MKITDFLVFENDDVIALNKPSGLLSIPDREGKEISLKRISEDQIAKKTTRTIYKGSGYTVILTTREGKQIGDEVSLDAGTLEIIFGQIRVKLTVHGQVGC